MAVLPPPGTFRMFSWIQPDTPAGSYVLQGDVTLPGPVQQLQASVEVVSPRYVLPPDQMLSCFPPARSRGDYSSRLPQVVLRRRTLPWERPFGKDDPIPWLALVVLAVGEAELRTDADVDQCVTPGILLEGPSDGPRGAYIEVAKSVLEATFPTRQDLSLLAHARQVDLKDTELAMGDDEGWLSVVLANRLPRPGVSYVAALISLEGQLDRLLDDTDVHVGFSDLLARRVVVDMNAIAAAQYGNLIKPDDLTRASRVEPFSGQADVLDAPGNDAIAGTELAATQARFVTPAAVDTYTAAPGWGAQGPAAASNARDGGALIPEGVAVRREMASAFAIPASILGEQTFRFPALAFWSFTCEGEGDFRSLSLGLDVGLVGDVRPQDAAPEPPPDAPPEAAAELPTDPRRVRSAETGHIALAHLTRRGEQETAWFRGPLTSAPVDRQEPDAAGYLPMAHAADQVRIVTPDGREDLSYASAFEIGRLLALSSPSVVGALQRWRQEAYGAARADTLAGAVVSGLPDALQSHLLAADGIAADTPTAQAKAVGSRLARGLLDVLGGDPAALAPSRALVDPGAAAVSVSDVGDDRMLSGLGVAGVEVPGAAPQPDAVAAALAGAPVASLELGDPGDPASYTALTAALESRVGDALNGALGRAVIGGGLHIAAPSNASKSAGDPGDALDALLAENDRRRTS